MITRQISVETPAFSEKNKDVLVSINSILSETSLCSLATVDNHGKPWINTIFFAVDEQLGLIWLTPPATQHSKNIHNESSIAIAVYSTEQAWDKSKRGLQLAGEANRLEGQGESSAFETYVKRYPHLLTMVAHSQNMDGIESRFYNCQLRSFKLFDEVTFGSEVWISGTFD